LGDSGNLTDAATPNASNVATLDLTTLDVSTNLVDGQVTLVITGNLSVTGANQYVQTSINSLTTDFTYNGNNGAGSVHWSNARLDGISQVVGGTLSN
jgi:hypothetical protein